MIGHEITAADIEEARRFCNARDIEFPSELARFVDTRIAAAELSEDEDDFLADILLVECIAAAKPLEFLLKIILRTESGHLAIDWAKAFAKTGVARLRLKDIIVMRDDGGYDLDRLYEWAMWVGDRDEMERRLCSRPTCDASLLAAWATTLGFRRKPEFDGYLNMEVSTFRQLELLAERELGSEYVEKARGLSYIQSTILYLYELTRKGANDIPKMGLEQLMKDPAWQARYGGRSTDEILEESLQFIREAPACAGPLPYRFLGTGYRWTRDDSLFDRVLFHRTPEKAFREKLVDVMRGVLAHPPQFELTELKCVPTGDVRADVYVSSGFPLTTYVVVDRDDNSLLWCEIFASPRSAPTVRLLEEHERPVFSPSTWHVTQVLPGLNLWGLSPPSNAGSLDASDGCVAAVVATRLRTHRRTDHSHAPGEPEGGGLYHPSDPTLRTYLDEVYFHGEVVAVESATTCGQSVIALQCRLDFGDKGRLTLPVIASASQAEDLAADPIRPTEYVHGLGSLQVCPLPA